MNQTELSADRPATRLATRLAFFVAGFGLACWAPLVPFAKQRLGVDDGMLGWLLLCGGAGSLIAMPITGPLSARYGSRAMIVTGGIGLGVVLPLLAVVNTPLELGLALLAFGASLSTLDVAMNIHAVDVERAASQPLMSGFHALFSVGGLSGSVVMTTLLSLQLPLLGSALLCAVVVLALVLMAKPRLLRAAHAKEGPLFVVPRGTVAVVAGLAAIMFLVEGALLDWGAVFLTGQGLVAEAHGGIGFVLFSIAMTVGRFGGDHVSARVGDRPTLFWGGLLAIAGFVVLLLAPVAAVALLGFLLIGLGASNVIPVLFRFASAQHAMPSALAVSAIAVTGYAGGLIGPAGVGFISHHAGLPSAFWIMAALVGLVPFCAGMVTREMPRPNVVRVTEGR